MNTAARVREVADVFAGRPGTGIRGADDLFGLLVSELGHAEVLDRPVEIEGVWRRASPPGLIYHVCASNLAVSAETALALGLVLGSQLVFKLPSGGLPGFAELAAGLPASLASRVRLLAAHDPSCMAKADAVVVFGGADAVEALHRQVRWDQKFVAYGPRLGVGWVLPGTASLEWAVRAVREILAFDQCGCLSPQAYLCATPEEAQAFAGHLAGALLEARPGPDPAMPTEVRGDVRELRLRARARGDRLWESPAHPGWTVVLRREPRIEPGPGYGWIEVLPSQDAACLGPWRDRISAISVTGSACPADLWTEWAALGIGRICRVGDLQDPPLCWFHDGAMRLAPLVHWLAGDPGMGVS